MIGNVLLTKLFNYQFFLRSRACNMGLSFFSGLALEFFIWRLLSFLIQNASASFYLSLIIILFIIILNKDNYKKYFDDSLKKLAYVGLSLLLFILFEILFSLNPVPNLLLTNLSRTSPFYGFGAVVHSLRAGNIALYIVGENYIPRFSQNYGQSLLASMPSFFGFSAPQFTLIVWIAIVLFFFGLLIYGFINYFTENKYFSFLGAAVSFVGNTALYFNYIEITDAGSSVLLIKNIDIIVGYATLLIFLLCSYLFASAKLLKKNNIIFIFFTIIMLAFVWNIIAAHNVILASILLLIVFFISTDTIRLRIQKIFYLFVALYLGSVLGAIICGGILLPQKFSDQVDIPGLMSLNISNIKQSAIELRPKMYIMNFATIKKTMSIINVIKNNKIAENEDLLSIISPDAVLSQTNSVSEVSQSSQYIFFKHFYSGFTNLFKKDQPLRWTVSIINIFFPLLGLFMSFILIRNNIFLDQSKIKLLKMMWISSSLLFIFGFFCSAFVVLSGKEIETSRFLGYGVFCAMLLLGLSVAFLFKEPLQIRGFFRNVIYVLLLVSLIGPSLQYGMVGIVGNFVMSAEANTLRFSLPVGTTYHTLDIGDRFRALVNIDQMAGEEYTQPTN